MRTNSNLSFRTFWFLGWIDSFFHFVFWLYLQTSVGNIKFRIPSIRCRNKLLVFYSYFYFNAFMPSFNPEMIHYFFRDYVAYPFLFIVIAGEIRNLQTHCSTNFFYKPQANQKCTKTSFLSVLEYMYLQLPRVGYKHKFLRVVALDSQESFFLKTTTQ